MRSPRLVLVSVGVLLLPACSQPCGDDGLAGQQSACQPSATGTSTGTTEVGSSSGPPTTGVTPTTDPATTEVVTGTTGDVTASTGDVTASTGEPATSTGDLTASTAESGGTTGTGTTGGDDPDVDMDGVPASMDCDDLDPNNFPGNDEVCDGQDNDCDDQIDDDPVDAQTYYPDMDMDGYGLDEGAVESCAPPPGTAVLGGDCNDADPDAFPDMNKLCPLGATCKTIFDTGQAGDDGLYLIDPDGVDAGKPPLQVWCDMTNSGRTAALIINSVNEGAYVGDFGEGDVSPDKLAIDPALASAVNAPATQAWLDLNLFPYTELWVADFGDGAPTYISNAIKRTDLRIKFGEDGYLLYNDPSGYYWCGGAKAYTDLGVGQVNQPPGAPNDCKNHTSLGSGWDFSLVGNVVNKGLTLCGGDPSTWMYKQFGASMVFYPAAGAAYVVWVR